MNNRIQTTLFWTGRRAPAAFVLALSMAAGCRGGDAAPAASTEAAGPRTIDVVRVVERPLDVKLSMPAELTPFQAVAIYPRVTGFVKTITVDRGSRVRTGQLLAVLEAPELLAQRAEAQSKLQAAEAQLAAVRSKAEASQGTYDRLKAASATPGVVAGNDVVLAQKAVEADAGQVASAQQTIEAARQALNAIREMESYLRISAPFDGVITERNVHPGALAGPTSGAGANVPLLRLVQDSRLRLVVPVPEAYVAGITERTSMPFSVASYPGETFTGTVARIARAVDVSTRTMAVELDVMNRDGRLAPGTFCQVQWPVRRTGPSLLVPSGSVTSTTGRTFVIRVRNGRAEWVDVTTGLGSGPLVEVFGDLHPGDQVAARGTDEIRPDMEVRVKDVTSAS
jgi:membrane fusion protein, multidrug efflux system